MAASFNWRASGNILASTFVSADSANPYYVLQSTSGSGAAEIEGVSQEGNFYAPGTGLDNGYAAISGQYIQVYQDQDHDEPNLLLGAAVTAGQLLIADASGRGIPLPALASGTNTTYYVGAESRDTNGVSGTLCRVIVRRQVIFV